MQVAVILVGLFISWYFVLKPPLCWDSHHIIPEKRGLGPFFLVGWIPTWSVNFQIPMAWWVGHKNFLWKKHETNEHTSWIVMMGFDRFIALRPNCMVAAVVACPPPDRILSCNIAARANHGPGPVQMYNRYLKMYVCSMYIFFVFICI